MNKITNAFVTLALGLGYAAHAGEVKVLHRSEPDQRRLGISYAILPEGGIVKDGRRFQGSGSEDSINFLFFLNADLSLRKRIDRDHRFEPQVLANGQVLTTGVQDAYGGFSIFNPMGELIREYSLDPKYSFVRDLIPLKNGNFSYRTDYYENAVRNVELHFVSSDLKLIRKIPISTLQIEQMMPLPDGNLLLNFQANSGNKQDVIYLYDGEGNLLKGPFEFPEQVRARSVTLQQLSEGLMGYFYHILDLLEQTIDQRDSYIEFRNSSGEVAGRIFSEDPIIGMSSHRDGFLVQSRDRTYDDSGFFWQPSDRIDFYDSSRKLIGTHLAKEAWQIPKSGFAFVLDPAGKSVAALSDSLGIVRFLGWDGKFLGQYHSKHYPEAGEMLIFPGPSLGEAVVFYQNGRSISFAERISTAGELIDSYKLPGYLANITFESQSGTYLAVQTDHHDFFQTTETRLIRFGF